MSKLVTQFSDGFIVGKPSQASLCKRQGCRVHDNGTALLVYPQLGRRINLPFKVEIGGSLASSVKLVKAGAVVLPTKHNQAAVHRTPATFEVW